MNGSFQEKRAIFEPSSVSRSLPSSSRNSEPCTNSRLARPNSTTSPAITMNLSPPPPSRTSLPSSFVLNPTSPIALPTEDESDNKRPKSRLPTRRIPIPTQRKASVRTLVNTFEAKLSSLKNPPPTVDQLIDRPHPSTALPPQKRTSGSHTHAIRTSLINLLSTATSRPRHSQGNRPKRLSYVWPEDASEHPSNVPSSPPDTCSSRSARRSVTGRDVIRAKRSSILPNNTFAPIKTRPESISKGLVEDTKQQLAYLNTCPTGLLDQEQFRSSTELHDRSSDAFLSLIEEAAGVGVGSAIEDEKNLNRESAGLMSPQHFPQLSSLPIHISKLAELAQHPSESTKAMLGKPSSLSQSSSCSFDTTSRWTSVPSDISLPINPFQNPESDETLMISPTFTQSSTSDLISLSKPTKLALRTSLPNFSTSHLLHRGGLMTIPFPSFDDDEEHAITEPIARSTLECALALGNRTLRPSQLSNKKDSLKLSDRVHEVMATIRKPSRQNAHSFLIGRKFDLDNDSLYGPQQSTDDEDDFKPEESPTAKGSRSRPSNTELKPMAAMTRYSETSSPSRSRPTVHPLPTSNQTPFPCMSVEDQANGDESPKPTARRFSIRKFSLRKHSGSPSALSTLPSTSASPEDIRRVNLGVERCGGLGNKMFDSGMRTLKRIVTAPPRSSLAVPSTTADSPASSQADRRLSLETPSRAFGSSINGGSPIHTELRRSGAPSGVQTPETKPSTPLVLLQRNHNIEDSPGAGNQTLSSSIDDTVDLSGRTLSPIPGPSRLSDLHQPHHYARSPRAQFDPELSGVDTEGEGLENVAQPDSTVDLANLDELFCSWRLLCHQVDQELKQSRERWPDTASSREALRTFVMPSSKDAIFEFLAHSRKTYGHSLPAPRRKPRTGLHSIFNHSQLDETEDSQSPHSRGLTPPPKHPFGSKPATPIYLRARSRQPPSSGANSPAQVPIIVTLPVPSAFVSPERFISPPSSLPRTRKSRKSSLVSNAPPTRPSSKYVDRIRNESIHSLVGVPPLTERSPNVSPVTHKPTSGLCRTYKLSAENGKKKDYNRDGLVNSLISSSPVRLNPICQISESSRKTKKAWQMGEKGKEVQKMTSQSSFWDTNESSFLNEEIQEEEQEETGVLVASGENTFAGNADLAGGAFTPGRSLRRYPSGRTPLLNRSNARSMLQLRSSVRSINRI